MYCLYNGNSFVAGGIGILVIADCVTKIVRLLINSEVSFTYSMCFKAAIEKWATPLLLPPALGGCYPAVPSQEYELNIL